MAITNNGTRNIVDLATLPSGYTPPTVTTFTDYEYFREVTFSVLKSTVENATATTTLANIISNGTIGITKQATDLIAADYLTTPTVTYWTDIIEINDNFLPRTTGDYFKATAFSYSVRCKIYLKTA